MINWKYRSRLQSERFVLIEIKNQEQRNHIKNFDLGSTTMVQWDIQEVKNVKQFGISSKYYRLGERKNGQIRNI